MRKTPATLCLDQSIHCRSVTKREYQFNAIWSDLADAGILDPAVERHISFAGLCLHPSACQRWRRPFDTYLSTPAACRTGPRPVFGIFIVAAISFRHRDDNLGSYVTDLIRFLQPVHTFCIRNGTFATEQYHRCLALFPVVSGKFASTICVISRGLFRITILLRAFRP